MGIIVCDRLIRTLLSLSTLTFLFSNAARFLSTIAFVALSYLIKFTGKFLSVFCTALGFHRIRCILEQHFTKLIQVTMMNIFQRILGTLFPPYRFSVIRKKQATLYTAIVNALPAPFTGLKQQLAHSRFMDLRDWALFPGYQFVEKAYSGESLQSLKKRGENYRIRGITLFSVKTGQEEAVELLINNNLITGLRITHSHYDLAEFDLQKINVSNVIKESIDFPPDGLALFYTTLPDDIKALLRETDVEEVEYGHRIFYSFFDLGDGNCLAMDKKMNVYSVVHDARPATQKMDTTLQTIIDEISAGTFDAQQHLDGRYGATA